MTNYESLNFDNEIDATQKTMFIDKVCSLLPPLVAYEDVYEDDDGTLTSFVDVNTYASYRVGSQDVFLDHHKLPPDLSMPDIVSATVRSEQFDEGSGKTLSPRQIFTAELPPKASPTVPGVAEYHEFTHVVGEPERETESEVRAYLEELRIARYIEEELGLNRFTVGKFQAVMAVLEQCGPHNRQNPKNPLIAG